MEPKDCMINLMADIIGLDDKYIGTKLNNDVNWESFMSEVFHRMDTIEDAHIKNILNTIDRNVFQTWIDDPKFWNKIDNEIVRRGELIKTILPSKNEGYC